MQESAGKAVARFAAGAALFALAWALMFVVTLAIYIAGLRDMFPVDVMPMLCPEEMDPHDCAWLPGAVTGGWSLWVWLPAGLVFALLTRNLRPGRRFLLAVAAVTAISLLISLVVPAFGYFVYEPHE